MTTLDKRETRKGYNKTKQRDTRRQVYAVKTRDNISEIIIMKGTSQARQTRHRRDENIIQ